MPTDLLIVGAGGHSKVVIEAIRGQDISCRITLVDQDKKKQNGMLLGDIAVEFLESWDDLPMVYHVAVGNNHHRRQLAMVGQQLNKQYQTVIHSNTSISTSASVGSGCFVAARAIIAAECKVGDGCIVNHGVIIDHDCEIGAYSHISPNATLSGGVYVGENCLIGSGAIVLPMVKIGNQVTIGAGAVVTSDVSDNQTLVGVPAKCLKVVE